MLFVLCENCLRLLASEKDELLVRLTTEEAHCKSKGLNLSTETEAEELVEVENVLPVWVGTKVAEGDVDLLFDCSLKLPL